MTEKPWLAEITTNETIVRACIAAQCQTLLPINSIKRLDSGWDNDVYSINDQWIARLPRRHIAVQLIERENQILPRIADSLSLAVPSIICQGQACEAFAYPFQIYQRLPGQAACYAQLSDQQWAASLPLIANFMRCLHNYDLAQAKHVLGDGQVFNRLERSHMLATFTQRLAQAQDMLLYEPAYLQALLDEVALLNMPKQQVLVHGDLYGKHVLFTGGKPSAVIDWGDVGINHPSIDWMFIHLFYAKDQHAEFFKRYGEVCQAGWRYARFLALYCSVNVVLYAQDVGDKPLLQHAQSVWQRVLTQ